MIARSWGFKSPLAHKVILDPPRPKRRVMGRFIWPIVVTAAVVAAFAVSGAGRDTRAELAYLDEVHDQVTDISIGGDALRGVVSRLPLAHRIEFVTVIDSLRADIELGLETVNAGPPSDALVAANALYRQALEAWNAGVSGLGSGVLVAADNRVNPLVVDNIADALAEMRAGDELYRALVVELGRDEVPSPLAPMPDVVLIPSDGGLASLSTAYVEAARSPTSRLLLRAGLGISQITSEPEWVTDPSDQAVLPATDSVVFLVVVSNTGNVVSFPEQLSLTVTGGPEEVGLVVDMEALQPDEQTTVRFDPVLVEPGVVYEVTVELILTGTDSSFEDNQVAVVFTVNEGLSDG